MQAALDEEVARRAASTDPAINPAVRVVDSWWYWHGQGRPDLGLVAEELSMSVSEVTRMINEAGKSGLYEARRPKTS